MPSGVKLRPAARYRGEQPSLPRAFPGLWGEPRALFAELMGRQNRRMRRRGGSQHLHWRNFYSNGVLGGTVPLDRHGTWPKSCAAAVQPPSFSLGEVPWEKVWCTSRSIWASLWQAPILYVWKNNHIAQTTPASLAVSGNIPAVPAFGIPCIELDSSDVLEIQPAAGRLLDECTISRPRGRSPHTSRFGPHSKGDDTRDPALVDQMRPHPRPAGPAWIPPCRGSAPGH